MQKKIHEPNTKYNVKSLEKIQSYNVENVRIILLVT